MENSGSRNNSEVEVEPVDSSDDSPEQVIDSPTNPQSSSLVPVQDKSVVPAATPVAQNMGPRASLPQEINIGNKKFIRQPIIPRRPPKKVEKIGSKPEDFGEYMPDQDRIFLKSLDSIEKIEPEQKIILKTNLSSEFNPLSLRLNRPQKVPRICHLEDEDEEESLLCLVPARMICMPGDPVEKPQSSRPSTIPPRRSQDERYAPVPVEVPPAPDRSPPRLSGDKRKSSLDPKPSSPKQSLDRGNLPPSSPKHSLDRGNSPPAPQQPEPQPSSPRRSQEQRNSPPSSQKSPPDPSPDKRETSEPKPSSTRRSQDQSNSPLPSSQQPSDKRENTDDQANTARRSQEQSNSPQTSKKPAQMAHGPTNPSVVQTLDELDFERGLWYAALMGDLEKVDLLLSKNHPPDAVDKGGYTALHYAARSGHADIVRRLIKARANVNAKTRAGGATPLHRAAGAGQNAIVKMLLCNGAEKIPIDSDGRTPLHRAVEGNHESTALLLLKQTPDSAHMKDKNGKKPLDLARNGSLREILFDHIRSTSPPTVKKPSPSSKPTTPSKKK